MVLILALRGLASAAITFSEVPLFTSDPDISVGPGKSLSFWAGNPAVLNDTFTADFLTPGDPYLASGYDDGTGRGPGLYDTFIGASSNGFTFGSCGFDIASEFSLPGGTWLWAELYSSGSYLMGLGIHVDDNGYHHVGMGPGTGFDTIYFYDDLDGFGFGEPFRIDNLEFTEYSGGGPVVPIPAPIALLGSGLVGGWFLKRKKRG